MNDLNARLEWFEADVLPHAGALRARLRRVRGGGEELDDLVNEVLTRAYANPRWNQVSNGRAYLFTIARNLLIERGATAESGGV